MESNAVVSGKYPHRALWKTKWTEFETANTFWLEKD